MKVILVPVADRPECVLALGAAFELAKRQGGNVVGCHVRPHRPESKADLGGLLPEDDVFRWLERAESVQLNSDAAHALFTRMVNRYGFVASKRPRIGKSSLAFWHELVGTPSKVLAIVGGATDVAVVSRPRPSGSGPARAFLLATLLYSGRPVLVLPQRRVPPLGQRVLIAWNQSAEAAAAVTAAIPILQQATEVGFVTAGPENRPGPKASAMCDYLAQWGIKADRVATKGDDVEQEILHTFEERGADLLVMGACHRSRLRELVFGGVTRRMLFDSTLPVLMYHR